jgi:N-acetylglucosamine kinase-like BadF-type ATPase
MRYFLGVDGGSTKTHTVIADENGRCCAFSKSGSANYQSVGFDKMQHALQQGLDQALAESGLTVAGLSGAGFGLSGYDWPSEEEQFIGIIRQIGLDCPIGLVNDAIPALFAAAEESRGVALVSGTGCNCRGWDPDTEREGRVTGFGYHMGEYAGAAELVWRAMQVVAFEWTQRGPQTALSTAVMQAVGATSLADLIEGYTKRYYRIGASFAPLIFQVAEQGDGPARDLIRWAGVELGEMAKAVIRQLAFEAREFDVVLSGSMFGGGPLLIEPMWATIRDYAPRARLVPLQTLPVVGAVILGMRQGGLAVTPTIRHNLSQSLTGLAAKN